MSAHPTRSGRHSLPPSAPSAARASTASASGGSHLRDGGVGNAKSPLSISISLGHLRGASEGSRSSPAPAGAGSSTEANGSGSVKSAAGGVTTPGTGPKKDKPKKKRGMKGWAWVVEDENGNVVDIPDEEDGRAGKGKKVVTVDDGDASPSGPPVESQTPVVITATTTADTVLQTPREEEKVVREEMQTPKSQGNLYGAPGGGCAGEASARVEPTRRRGARRGCQR
ncbi:hypothetical protein B9479_006145 [Cryptococcus floricola]|uniref:Uncharacterized protein n=1 Tax=Cryptococcus floricola TaxID=2591691 RepID=A0A5D3AR24_9TREE|nr:hypothetical protein B9479_006145 [Cryptococcus floricola]